MAVPTKIRVKVECELPGHTWLTLHYGCAMSVVQRRLALGACLVSKYLTAVKKEEITPCYAQCTCLIVYMSLLMAAQIVVLSQVLACDATLGYEEIHNTQVLRFNGTKIRNLAHLAELTTTCDQPFMRFDLDLDVRPTPLDQVPRIRCHASHSTILRWG